MNTIKIPTLLAILFIAVAISTVALLSRYFSIPAQADVGKQPRDVLITSITDTGFTVTWQTEKPTRGTVSVTNKSGGTPLTFVDERYAKDGNQLYSTHSVLVSGLKPQSTYSVKIIPNEILFDTERVYEITTGPTLPANSNQLGPVYGTVVTADGKPAEGALVFVTLSGSQTVSAIVKSSGSFLIPLNIARTEDLSSYLPAIEEKIPMTITVRYIDQIASATTDTLNDSPVPEMILGETYDFRGGQSKKKNETPSTVAQAEFTFSSVLGTTDNKPASEAIRLLSPQKGARITSTYPFITGTGIPDSFVTITIGTKDPEIGTTKVLQDGTWKYTPKKPVGIGSQSVTMTTTDTEKKPVAITHLFEIMKSGTQVLGNATGSAVPTFSVPTATPTIAVSTITPQITPEITPTPTIPSTGVMFPTIGILGAGVITALVGLGLLIH